MRIWLIFLVSVLTTVAFADEIPLEGSTQSSQIPSPTAASATTAPAPTTMPPPVVTATTEDATQAAQTAPTPTVTPTTPKPSLEPRVSQLEQAVKELQGKVEIQTQSLLLLNKRLERVSQSADTQPKPVTDQEAAQYQAGVTLLTKQKNYAAAASKFQEYLAKQPTGKYAANAYYWLGEIYYANSQFTDSKNAFQTVIDKYPDSAKVPDAMYKLGMIYEIEGKSQQAKQTLQTVVTKYATSTAAQLAKQRLQQK